MAADRGHSAAERRQAGAGRHQLDHIGKQAWLAAAHTCLQCWEVQHMNSTDHLQTDPAAAQLPVVRFHAMQGHYHNQQSAISAGGVITCSDVRQGLTQDRI